VLADKGYPSKANRLFAVRGDHGLLRGVHAAVFAALASRIRVR